MLRGLLRKLGLGTGVGGGWDSVGARGEDVAAAFLQRAGYTILDRNVRVSVGEADIVARSAEGVIVLVEVKSRVVDPSRKQPKAEEQVGAFKRRKLLAIMQHLVRANGWERVKKRIDVVAVEFVKGTTGEVEGEPVVRHLVNAVKP